MSIKINFTGAQGTGKTTILNALKDDPELIGFEFVTEVVRNFIKDLGIKINKDGTPETQRLVFDAYAELVRKKNSFVSDRCVFDVCAYTRALTEASPLESKDRLVFLDCLRKQREFIHYYGQSLGLIFYFPIEFPLVNDSIRSMDVDYQKEIDRNIRFLLETMEVPYITVTGTVEERINIIKRTLSENSY